LILDHIAVAARTLDEGAAWVEAELGVSLAEGGKHSAMGTHNRLLSLGDIYLEVIAIDPEAPRPAGRRWFDLDRFVGPPRLVSWVCRTDDLDAALASAPEGAGRPVVFMRGPYRWRMALPETGILPFDNAYPALMQWDCEVHPVAALPKSDVRLRRLEIVDPEGGALKKSLAGKFTDPRVVITTEREQVIRARFSTPHGTRTLT
jgi:Glyoxalase-like domain